MAVPMPNLQSQRQFIHQMEQLVLSQRDPIAALKLAAYAADAMRVLTVFEQHADMSQPIDDMLRSVCTDWRNPGSIYQPADLISVVLAQVVEALQKVHDEMEQVITATASSAPVRQSGPAP